MELYEQNTPNEEVGKNLIVKKDSKSLFMLIAAVILFLFSSTILAGVFLYFESQKVKSPQGSEVDQIASIPEITYTQDEVDRMINDAVVEASEEARAKTHDEMTRVMRTASEENSGMLLLLRSYFPDQVVFIEGSKYSYYPVDQSLKPNTIDSENLEYDEENKRLYYKEDGNNISSHMGIDVSSHQKNIDWKKVKESGVDFAFIRCAFRGYGSGKIVEDDYFTKNISGALEAGIKVGVYFYSQAISIEEAVEEAKYTLELIAPYNVTLPVVIDIEEVNDSARTDNLTTEQRTDFVVAFCDEVKNAGYTPMVYSNLRFFIKSLDCSKMDDIEKWYALYNTSIYFPYEISVWQYSAEGKVDGISGTVDINISFKDWE